MDTQSNSPEHPEGFVEAGLKTLGQLFSPQVAVDGASVTNLPSSETAHLGYEAKLQLYARKVESAAQTIAGWITGWELCMVTSWMILTCNTTFHVSTAWPTAADGATRLV